MIEDDGLEGEEAQQVGAAIVNEHIERRRAEMLARSDRAQADRKALVDELLDRSPNSGDDDE